MYPNLYHMLLEHLHHREDKIYEDEREEGRQARVFKITTQSPMSTKTDFYGESLGVMERSTPI